MKLEKLRVSIAYGRGSDTTVVTTADVVSSSLYAVAAFVNPPVTKVQLDAGRLALSNAMAACVNGGPATTAEKNNRRAELVAMLDRLAYFALGESNNDLALLLSSGFQNVSTNRAQSQLPAPNVLRIDNGLSGQALVTVDAIANARCFALQYALIDADGVRGGWIDAGLFTSSRRMPVDGLTPGQMIAVQSRAIGGSTGASDWSNVVTYRAA